ncbi:MAG: hypothetical protein HY678_02530 [Chloroflexi bacterium]|nr:hypothetical protein [Chloroflexota bacterium]
MSPMLAGQRVLLGQAQVIAWGVEIELRPYCERIEIAGSIRRRKETIGDVEIVCIPKAGRVDLFGTVLSDQITDYLASQIGGGRCEKRPNIRGITTFGPANKLLLYGGFPVDVFSTTVRNWGMSMFIRTGPAEWNIKAMQTFQCLGMEGHSYGGVTGKDGREIDCPDEALIAFWQQRGGEVGHNEAWNLRYRALRYKAWSEKRKVTQEEYDALGPWYSEAEAAAGGAA